MKTLVVYQSATGFTEQYARWIASELTCNALEIKQVSANEIASSDRVIYGGWLMGNTISGLDKIRNMSPRRLAVFAVGVTPDSPAHRNAVRDQNHLNDLPFFYMEGGIRYEKLGLVKKIMLKAVQKALSKKPDKTEQELFMEKNLGSSFYNSDRTYIAELTAWAKEA